MHFELIASDPRLLRSYYTALFGWSEDDYPEAQYTILKSGEGQGIDFAVGSTMSGLSPGPTIYVAVEDVDATLSTARSLAGTAVIQEPYEIEGMGRFAVFSDPEGNRIGLWKMGGTK
jgi:predicted enzyme related to lactoylglutathione lyase